jgi:16S rRNA processing protein RimM
VGEGRRPLEVQAFRAHGRGFVAQVGGVTDRDQAMALTGLDILVPRSVLPEPVDSDEYYWRDLIGLEVRNDDGSPLGRVRSLLGTGAHDVLVLESADGERLIPFAAAFVLAVDRQAGIIRVRWQDPA